MSSYTASDTARLHKVKNEILKCMERPVDNNGLFVPSTSPPLELANALAAEKERGDETASALAALQQTLDTKQSELGELQSQLRHLALHSQQPPTRCSPLPIAKKMHMDTKKRDPADAVFVPMCCDFFHVGHINILNTAAALGDVVVLLMTDEAMRKYKRDPAMPYEQRRTIVSAMRQVADILPCNGVECFAAMVLEHRPGFFLHGDDWKTGPQQGLRMAVIKACDEVGARVVEPMHFPGVHVACDNW